MPFVLSVEEINVERISRDEARQIRNELMTISNGNLEMNPDKYPQLNKLFKLLAGAFDSSYEGVHKVKLFKKDG